MATFFAFDKLQAACFRMAAVLEDTFDDKGHPEALPATTVNKWR